MPEYIERKAAIGPLLGWAAQLTETYGKNDEYVKCLESAAHNIEQIPAADVRPVVLCRECKHWETDWTPQGVSDGRHYCAPLDLFPSADWYCSDGEKREES